MNSFVLDSRALARARASQILAIDPRALGQVHALSISAAGSRVEKAGSVAVIDISGPLSQRAMEHMCGISDGYDSIESRYAAALEDESVTAVVLRIDSPGGDAAGLLESVRRMSEARDKARKPTYAYANELAASAAYALATVANAGIYLPASGAVGSVGTVAVHVDESQALADDGLKVTVFRSGKRKMEGSSIEPLSEEASAAMQAMVDTHAAMFAGVVADARGMKRSDVLALEGAVFMGAEAVKAGLANKVLGFDAVMRLAERGGREAAKEKRMKSIAKVLGLHEDASETEIEAGTERVVSERNAFLKATGKATAAEGIGVIEAHKADSAALAAERAANAALRAEQQDAKAKALIDEAFRVRKLVPATKAKAEAFYAQFGLEALEAYVDALVPLAAATEMQEPKGSTGSADTKPVASIRWEDLNNSQRHNLFVEDKEAYASARADYEQRTGKRVGARN